MPDKTELTPLTDPDNFEVVWDDPDTAAALTASGGPAEDDWDWDDTEGGQ